MAGRFAEWRSAGCFAGELRDRKLTVVFPVMRVPFNPGAFSLAAGRVQPCAKSARYIKRFPRAA